MSTTERQIVRGACAHDCPDGCSFISEVENGRVVDFYANPDHPITQGWLCAKVRPYLDRVYDPNRLQYPMRRTGPKGSKGSSPGRVAPPSCFVPSAARWVW